MIQKVAGPSAYALFKGILISLILWVFGGVAVGVSIFVTRDPVSPPVLIALAISALAIASTFILARITTAKREKENAAGYTSSPISMFDFPEMDTKSGKIIREANEPRLAKTERKRRLLAARLLK